MPARTRDEMHILLDVELEFLQSSKFNTLDPAAKDLLLQGAVDDFIKETIDAANPPNSSKRLPGGVVVYQDIISKYNSIHTLIKEQELTARVAGTVISITDVTLVQLGVTTSYHIQIHCTNPHNLKSGDKIIITGLTVNTTIYTGTYTVGTIVDTTHFNIESLGVFTSISTINADGTYTYTYSSGYVQYSLPTDVFAFETSYSEVSLTGCSTTKLVPNLLPTLYDIATLKLDPFVKKTGCLLSSIQNNYMRVETYNNLYTIYKTILIYIKNPAIISDIADCDLPGSVHDEIVKRAARSISAFNNNPSYPAIANEIKTTEQ